MTASRIQFRNRLGRFAPFRHRDSDVDLRLRGPVAIAADPRTFPEDLQALAHEVDADVRENVARNPSSPVSSIRRLLHDPEPTVRAAAATHHLVADEHLRLMLLDPHPAPVEAAKRALIARNAPLAVAGFELQIT